MTAEPLTLSDEEMGKLMAALAEAANLPSPRLPVRGSFDFLSPRPPEPMPVPGAGRIDASVTSAVMSAEDLKDLRQQRIKLEARFAFWAEHYGELADAYPEQFIAVIDGCVVAAEKDLFRLWTELDRLGIHEGAAAVEFMTTQPRFLLL